MKKVNKKLQNKLFSEFNSYMQFSLIGESGILAEFTKLGLQCYLPFGDIEHCDLVVSFKGILKRIQIKSVYSIKNDRIKVELRSRNNTISKTYNSSEIDFFGVYSYENDQCYLIPISMVDGQGNIILRLSSDESDKHSLTSHWADEFILTKVVNNILKNL